MKKLLFLLAAAILIAGCTKKNNQKQQDKQSEQTETKRQPTVGSQYINLTALTPDGEELSLSDIVGKTDFVLIDFWASWCGPCRMFIPELKAIYTAQAEGHLQIFSCSLDADEAAWRTALQQENMPWLQVRDNAEYGCADKYNVMYIPYTVLIDRNGKIVALNPKKQELTSLL